MQATGNKQYAMGKDLKMIIALLFVVAYCQFPIANFIVPAVSSDVV